MGKPSEIDPNFQPHLPGRPDFHIYAMRSPRESKTPVDKNITELPRLLFSLFFAACRSLLQPRRTERESVRGRPRIKASAARPLRFSSLSSAAPGPFLRYRPLFGAAVVDWEYAHWHTCRVLLHQARGEKKKANTCRFLFAVLDHRPTHHLVTWCGRELQLHCLGQFAKTHCVASLPFLA